MAFAVALRRAASSVAPLVTLCRLVSRRSCSPRSPLLHRFSPHSSFASRPFSSTAAARLVKVIDDEIKSSSEPDVHHGHGVPADSDFPFEIVDNPGDETITLKREYANETISVSVLNPEADACMKDPEEEEGSGDEDDSMNLSILLNVTIDKGDASSLEFSCSVNTKELHIHHLTVKNGSVSEDQRPYEGPPFSDLDEELQDEFYKYLEARGIGSYLFELLHDYMIKKDDREYIRWLKGMKEFVEA